MIDWYSRYVVSWELDQSLEIDFVLTAVKRALHHYQPVILNSDSLKENLTLYKQNMVGTSPSSQIFISTGYIK
ncbi:hypothetical protein HMPREF0083_01255 [Aneurinibacillus aneurinilyticus ATCC 12856]|uniref:Integrase catalytic domain-containing protein n=1 Tax=Aneurinibacillus aneurinilyticus ATCC 12856 TaxID=649747 RepID=U1X6Q4_ANEAE|nr:hypothetical protein HMPREF0083_01255 [Aneurinibacillus aneurinilyticus ATCC 12856]